MPDKLTDNEIKKALEDKIEFENFDENGYAVVDIEKLKNALDLINRLQAEKENLNAEVGKMVAENERLASSASTLTKSISELTDEVERQKKAKDESFQLAANIVEAEKIVIVETKTEAYKEFAEQVKMAFYYEFDELIPSIMADKIDNLLKKMAGDGSGKM